MGYFLIVLIPLIAGKGSNSLLAAVINRDEPCWRFIFLDLIACRCVNGLGASNWLLLLVGERSDCCWTAPVGDSKFGLGEDDADDEEDGDNETWLFGWCDEGIISIDQFFSLYI